jgi:predicted phage baseplate assembly protein
VKALGVVTVVVLPYLPTGKPEPSQGLLAAVRRYLHRRRVVTTRVEVIGPTYLEVQVRAKVQALPGASPGRVREEIIQALNNFLNPLPSNPDTSGRPFGRDVYRSEILQVIDGVAGVDHVLALELIPGDGEPQCGNLLVCPTWLVTPGTHEIEVVRG